MADRAISSIGVAGDAHCANPEKIDAIDAIDAQVAARWWCGQSMAIDHRAGAPRGVQEHCAVSAIPALPALGQTHQFSARGEVPPKRCSAADDPDVQEAAILFASGDVGGSRVRLLERLGVVLHHLPVDACKLDAMWCAALDHCCATGDASKFETLAIDYATYFGRSAPLWISLPERLGSSARSDALRTKGGSKPVQWVAPEGLGTGGVLALRAYKEAAQQPWYLSWAPLNEIDATAIQPLADLFNEWADSPGALVYSDAAKLRKVLEPHATLPAVEASLPWWQLRMAWLRLTGCMDAYEQVALAYCVAYEVSPPPWVTPQCCAVQGMIVSSTVQAAEHFPQGGALPALTGVSVAVEDGKGLSGVLEGSVRDKLHRLREQAQLAGALDVSCEHLIRMDFAAANSVLHWAAEMQNYGVQLRFTHVHHLIAALFHVMGIHEHAQVQVGRG